MNPANSNAVNFLTDVKETRTPLSHRLFFYGNQVFIVTQQNIERIENMTTFNFGILTPNGDVIHLDPSQHNALFSAFLNQLELENSACYHPTPNENPLRLTPIMPNAPNDDCYEKMDTTPSETKPFHLTYTRGTSSTELSSSSVKKSLNQHSTTRCHKRYVLVDVAKSNASHTDAEVQVEVEKDLDIGTETINSPKPNARERLKLKKIRYDESFA